MNPKTSNSHMANFPNQHIKSTFIFCLVLVFGACKEDPARHLNLGNWYLNKGLIEEAIVEYREVARAYSGNESKLTREEFDKISNSNRPYVCRMRTAKVPFFSKSRKLNFRNSKKL